LSGWGETAPESGGHFDEIGNDALNKFENAVHSKIHALIIKFKRRIIQATWGKEEIRE